MPFPDPFVSLLLALGLAGFVVPGILKLGTLRNGGNQVTANSLSAEDLEQMVGKRMDRLIERFGLPDAIRTKEVFQTKFAGRERAEVVLTYDRFGRNVWMNPDSEIIAVLVSKESLTNP
jgi:hypothetical protein